MPLLGLADTCRTRTRSQALGLAGTTSPRLARTMTTRCHAAAQPSATRVPTPDQWPVNEERREAFEAVQHAHSRAVNAVYWAVIASVCWAMALLTATLPTTGTKQRISITVVFATAARTAHGEHLTVNHRAKSAPNRPSEATVRNVITRTLNQAGRGAAGAECPPSGVALQETALLSLPPDPGQTQPSTPQKHGLLGKSREPLPPHGRRVPRS